MQEIVFVTFQYKITEMDAENGQDAAVKLMENTIAGITSKCSVTFNLINGAKEGVRYQALFAVTLVGPFSQVIALKNELFKQNPSVVTCRLSCLYQVLLKENGEMKNNVKLKFQELKQDTGTEVFCVGNGNRVDIEIVGKLDKVERARMLCLVLLDELFGLSVLKISVPLKMHPIIAGRKRHKLINIMTSSKSLFYLPIPFSVSIDDRTSVEDFLNTIYITGKPSQIENAAAEFHALCSKLESQVVSKKVNCSPRKMEWLYQNRKDEIRKIMLDNAIDIQFPNFNTNANTLVFSGLHINLIDRAIRAFKRLICDYYVLSIQTANTFESAEHFTKYCNDLLPILQQTYKDAKFDILIHKNIIEIYGLAAEAQKAYQLITQSNMVKIRDTKVQVELAMEHKDFINGKKNGKINRIIKLSGCRVSFQDNTGDINMLIDLYSPSPPSLIQGLLMLEEELPAEMSFFVPEVYHKRIIGVAGKNIQKIMKRFGVYVKFSNMEEFELLGGYYENEDNVICRTPAKNAENLRDLKQTIVEAVNAPDLLEVSVEVRVSRHLLHFVLGEDGMLINQVKRDYQTRVSISNLELGKDSISLTGPENMIGQAKERFNEAIPIVKDLEGPGSAALLAFIKTAEFASFVKKQSENGVELFISLPAEEYHFAIYLVLVPPTLISAFDESKREIQQLFADKKIPFSHSSRSESFAIHQNTNQSSYDSFQHFNSKLLAPVGGTTHAIPESTRGHQSFGIFSAPVVTGQTTSTSHTSLRQFFDDTAIQVTPPAVRKGGVSVIGRPTVSIRETRHDYLQNALTMPDLTDLSFGKSQSMTDIMQANIGSEVNATFAGYPWGARQFGKSLSASALSKEGELELSPTDLEFDQKMQEQVSAFDTPLTKDFNRLAVLLKPIEDGKYIPLFAEHEIDYTTFVSLEDGDLKELGIKALGSRKKILAAIDKEKMKRLSPDRLGV